MTRRETGIIMDILATAYPRFYAGPDAPDPVKAMNLWAELFAHDDVEVVAAAVKSLIETDQKGFPPNIGQVKAKMQEINMPVKALTGKVQPGENYMRMLGYLQKSRELLKEVQEKNGN